MVLGVPCNKLVLSNYILIARGGSQFAQEIDSSKFFANGSVADVKFLTYFNPPQPTGNYNCQT